MKKRSLICLVIALALISAVLAFRYAPRPLLSCAESAESVLSDAGLFQILCGGSFGGDVTHLVNRDELFDLLSQTWIWRTNSANWPGAANANWVLQGVGRRQTIAIRGEEGFMLREVGFGMYAFRLSNAGEIAALLEPAFCGIMDKKHPSYGFNIGCLWRDGYTPLNEKP